MLGLFGRYRQSLDPTLDEVRRLATGLRRSAREERVLFHYNGHGVRQQQHSALPTYGTVLADPYYFVLGTKMQDDINPNTVLYCFYRIRIRLCGGGDMTVQA